MYVVSQVQTSNGIGGNYTSNKYAGAKADHAGRGFLGFRQVTVKDEQTLVEQATEYLQTWPFVGLTSKRTKTRSIVELNRTENTYAADDLGGDGHSKTAVNTYANDLTNWFLGRLTRAEVSSVTL